MIKILENVITRASSWPKEAQEELARCAREIEFEVEQSAKPHRISDEERAAIDEGLAQADRGECVSDEGMEAYFRRRAP